MLKGKDIINVKARIRLKIPEEGGRTHGIKTGYRPNHVFEPPNVIGKLQTWIGQIEFDDQEFIQPGETKIVTVAFLKHYIVKYMKVGQKWLICEGPRCIGEGEILEIIQSSD